MPRQTRRPPVDITRFNYWDLEIAQPRAAVVLADDEAEAFLRGRRQFLSTADEGEAFLAERLALHLHQGRCGERLCRVDRVLAQHPSRRAELALRDYVEYSRLWRQNALVHQELKALPPARRKALMAFVTRQYDIGRRRWDRILDDIRADLGHFEQMVPDGLRAVVKTTDDTYSAMRKVWQAYATQSLALLGRGPTTLEIAIGVAAAAAGGRQRARLDLRDISPKEQAYVVHWFHHAARNLIRYRNGDPALPFDHPTCAQACRAALSQTRPARPRTAR